MKHRIVIIDRRDACPEHVGAWAMTIDMDTDASPNRVETTQKFWFIEPSGRVRMALPSNYLESVFGETARTATTEILR